MRNTGVWKSEVFGTQYVDLRSESAIKAQNARFEELKAYAEGKYGKIFFGWWVDGIDGILVTQGFASPYGQDGRVKPREQYNRIGILGFDRVMRQYYDSWGTAFQMPIPV